MNITLTERAGRVLEIVTILDCFFIIIILLSPQQQCRLCSVSGTGTPVFI